jgi:hypothetical protein
MRLSGQSRPGAILVAGLLVGRGSFGITAGENEVFPQLDPRRDLVRLRTRQDDTGDAASEPTWFMGPPAQNQAQIPLHITNNCPDTIWPGIAWGEGTGPGIGGFELVPGRKRKFRIGADFRGRVWARTNCTVSGSSAVCATGDCSGQLDCRAGVSPPPSS